VMLSASERFGARRPEKKVSARSKLPQKKGGCDEDCPYHGFRFPCNKLTPIHSYHIA